MSKFYDEECPEALRVEEKKVSAVSVSLAGLELGGCLLAVHLDRPLLCQKKAWHSDMVSTAKQKMGSCCNTDSGQ